MNKCKANLTVFGQEISQAGDYFHQATLTEIAYRVILKYKKEGDIQRTCGAFCEGISVENRKKLVQLFRAQILKKVKAPFQDRLRAFLNYVNQHNAQAKVKSFQLEKMEAGAMVLDNEWLDLGVYTFAVFNLQTQLKVAVLYSNINKIDADAKQRIREIELKSPLNNEWGHNEEKGQGTNLKFYLSNETFTHVKTALELQFHKSQELKEKSSSVDSNPFEEYKTRMSLATTKEFRQMDSKQQQFFMAQAMHVSQVEDASLSPPREVKSHQSKNKKRKPLILHEKVTPPRDDKTSSNKRSAAQPPQQKHKKAKLAQRREIPLAQPEPKRSALETPPLSPGPVISPRVTRSSRAPRTDRKVSSAVRAKPVKAKVSKPVKKSRQEAVAKRKSAGKTCKSNAASVKSIKEKAGKKRAKPSQKTAVAPTSRLTRSQSRLRKNAQTSIGTNNGGLGVMSPLDLGPASHISETTLELDDSSSLTEPAQPPSTLASLQPLSTLQSMSMDWEAGTVEEFDDPVAHLTFHSGDSSEVDSSQPRSQASKEYDLEVQRLIQKLAKARKNLDAKAQQGVEERLDQNFTKFAEFLEKSSEATIEKSKALIQSQRPLADLVNGFHGWAKKCVGTMRTSEQKMLALTKNQESLRQEGEKLVKHHKQMNEKLNRLKKEREDNQDLALEKIGELRMLIPGIPSNRK